MDKSVVLIVLVVCFVLVQDTKAGCLFGCHKNVDLETFNRWLVRTLPDGSDAESNLAHVRSHLDKLTEPKVKRAAEIFVEFLEAKRCNGQTLLNAREMVKDGVKMNGLKRIERLMGSKLERMMKHCGEYVDEAVEQTYRDELQDELARFLEELVLRPNGWKPPLGTGSLLYSPAGFPEYLAIKKNHELDPTSDLWAQVINRLAVNDPQAVVRETKVNEAKGTSKIVHHADRFKYAYDMYLVRPCEKVKSSVGYLFEGLYALNHHLKYPVDRYCFPSRSTAFQQLLYAYKACLALPTPNSRKMKQLARYLTHH